MTPRRLKQNEAMALLVAAIVDPATLETLSDGYVAVWEIDSASSWYVGNPAMTIPKGISYWLMPDGISPESFEMQIKVMPIVGYDMSPSSLPRQHLHQKVDRFYESLDELCNTATVSKMTVPQMNSALYEAWDKATMPYEHSHMRRAAELVRNDGRFSEYNAKLSPGKTKSYLERWLISG